MLLYIKKMITKINVLQVIPKLGYGGAETGCYDIAHYLAEKECGSYIATSGGELLKFVKKNRVGIFKIPVHSKNPILIFFGNFFHINLSRNSGAEPIPTKPKICFLKYLN